MQDSQEHLPGSGALLILNNSVHNEIQISPSGALNSWKEIAAYLGRGVRTVQRWEREAGLPIHRPYRRKRTSVLALKREIDAWLVRDGAAARQEPAA